MRPFAIAGSYLVVEMTNGCSLACVHCSVAEANHPHHKKIGFTPTSTIDRVFADLQAHQARFDTLILFWLGEPLLHPAFGRIYQNALRTAATGAFRRVEVHTNATHLTPEKTRVILNRSQVPQSWHFSLDAATPETYKKIKARDRFFEVEANIEQFLTERARLGAPWPRPVFQLIVSDQNAHEVARFCQRWEKTCRTLGSPALVAAQHVPEGSQPVIFLRQLDCPTPEEQSKQNQVFARVVRELGLGLPRPEATAPVTGDARGLCGCLWKSPVVGWDGRVTTCTRDNRQENALGSVLDRSFSELWWGPAMREHRKKAIQGDYSGLKACTDCFIPRSGNYSGITPGELVGLG